VCLTLLSSLGELELRDQLQRFEALLESRKHLTRVLFHEVREARGAVLRGAAAPATSLPRRHAQVRNPVNALALGVAELEEQGEELAALASWAAAMVSGDRVAWPSGFTSSAHSGGGDVGGAAAPAPASPPMEHVAPSFSPLQGGGPARFGPPPALGGKTWARHTGGVIPAPPLPASHGVDFSGGSEQHGEGLLTVDQISRAFRSTLRIMTSSIASVKRLLDGFLTVDRIDSGAGLGMELAPFSTAGFMETAAMRVAPNANHGGITLTTHVAPDVPPLVVGDFHRLMQVRAVASLGIGGGRGRLWPATRATMCRSTSALCAWLVWRHDAAWRRVQPMPRHGFRVCIMGCSLLGRRGRVACPAPILVPTTATWLVFTPLGARV
jgi:signal transduction histidine kinase